MARNWLGAARAATLLGSAVIIGGTALLGAAPAFAAAPAPTITSLNVTKGSTVGGTNVLITGTGFLNLDEATAADVKFGTVNATSFLILSDTQIAAKAPAWTSSSNAGSYLVDIVLKNTDAVASVPNAASKFQYRKPIVTTAPTTLANPSGGSVVTLTSDFDWGANDATHYTAEKITVTVNGTAVAATGVVWKSNTTVDVTIPAGTPSDTAASVAILHDGIAGTADTTHVKYPSVITALSRTSGPLTSTGSITITGKGMNHVDLAKIAFGATNFATGCTIGTGTTAEVITCTAVPAAPGGDPGAVSVTYANKTSDTTPAGILPTATYVYQDVK